jgi:hypothetical protein
MLYLLLVRNLLYASIVGIPLVLSHAQFVCLFFQQPFDVSTFRERPVPLIMQMNAPDLVYALLQVLSTVPDGTLAGRIRPIESLPRSRILLEGIRKTDIVVTIARVGKAPRKDRERLDAAVHQTAV